MIILFMNIWQVLILLLDRCNQVCENQPCQHKKSLIFCIYVIINIYTNVAESFPLLQILMSFPLQFTEMEYYTQNYSY